MTTDPGREALATLQRIVDECAELRRLAYDQAATIAVLRNEHNQMRGLLVGLAATSRIQPAQRAHIAAVLERTKP